LQIKIAAPYALQLSKLSVSIPFMKGITGENHVDEVLRKNNASKFSDFTPRRIFKVNLNLTRKKSNSSDAKIVSVHLYFLHLKPDFRYSSLSLVKLTSSRNTDKLAAISL